MSYFFSDKSLSANSIAELSGEEARHILLSRRMKTGQRFNLQDTQHRRFLAEVSVVDKKSLKVKILEQLAVPAEPAVKITLCLSVVSEAALDFILQKGTELGLSKLILFNSKNTATKLTSEVFEKKHGRWQKIVMEAAKQSDRGFWPEIEFADSLPKLQQFLANNVRIILTDISGKTFNSALAAGETSVALIIGPEGGFTPEEIKEFKNLPKIETINLGPVLLRADTAALAGLALFRLGVN